MNDLGYQVLPHPLYSPDLLPTNYHFFWHFSNFLQGKPQGASHDGSEKSGKLEVGGASRHSTGFGALEEGLISS